MRKATIWRILCICCCLFCYGLIAVLQSPSAHAATPQVMISQAGSNGGAVGGQVGSSIHLSGSGFTPGTVNLYTTTNNDPTKCTNQGQPGNLGLMPFTPATATAQQDGTFALDTTWPNSAGTVGAAYYICAVTPTASMLSSNTFTVTPAPTIVISPTSIAAGGQITITGENWFPPQQLTVAVTDATQTVIVSQQTNPDQTGKINVMLTIPATAPAGTDTVSVAANDNPSLKVVQNNALTITATSTPTPTVSPSPSPTPASSPTAASTNVPATPTSSGGNAGGNGGSSSNGGGGGTINILLFLMAGLGIILVIVGIILFAAYSRERQ